MSKSFKYNGYVYAITHNGRTKIGRSRVNPEKRTNAVMSQAGIPKHECQVSHFETGDHCFVEIQSHKDAKEHRITGEWFTISHEVAIEIIKINLKPLGEPCKPSESDAGELAMWCARGLLSEEERAILEGKALVSDYDYCGWESMCVDSLFESMIEGCEFSSDILQAAANDAREQLSDISARLYSSSNSTDKSSARENLYRGICPDCNRLCLGKEYTPQEADAILEDIGAEIGDDDPLSCITCSPCAYLNMRLTLFTARDRFSLSEADKRRLADLRLKELENATT